MAKNIPEYSLNSLSQHAEGIPDVFFLDTKIERSRVAIDIPFRRNFYAVGFCIKGKAELKTNLDTYTIKPGCLVTKPPHTINQWTYMSEDFETLTFFFTKAFLTANNNINPDKFNFFDTNARHVFKTSAAQSGKIIASLNFLLDKYNTPNAYRNEILRNHISSLLYEIASVYNDQDTALNATQTRSQLLASEFKKLVYAHFSTQRNLKFYAEKLFITSKHLTETVKEITGKTASDLIEEAVILEAKILLQNPALTIAQISDSLHFSDQSTFGRFFKRSTGLSPAAYKQLL